MNKTPRYPHLNPTRHDQFLIILDKQVKLAQTWQDESNKYRDDKYSNVLRPQVHINPFFSFFFCCYSWLSNYMSDAIKNPLDESSIPVLTTCKSHAGINICDNSGRSCSDRGDVPSIQRRCGHYMELGLWLIPWIL